MKLLFILLLTILYTLSSFTGRVVRVIDGDTIVVITENNKQIKVRMEAKDCPEQKQDFRYQAKQATTRLCFDKEVRIKNQVKITMEELWHLFMLERFV